MNFQARFKNRCLLAATVLCTALLAWAITGVDPRTVFEVNDGDTITGNSGSANCDWNTLNAGLTADTNTPATPCAGDSAALNAYGFLVGSANEKNFSGGGSKDPIDITSWKWTTTSTPDKDTLTHGYAASYAAPFGAGTHKVLVFGSERFAVNGDANIGIWFFQQTVAPNAAGGFDGVHVNGDIFAVSAFTGGGGHPELDVYQWDSTCNKSHYSLPAAVGNCADTNLRLLFSGSGGDLCNGGVGCATVNPSPITLAWDYASKFGGSANQVPSNGFFEGGFDLSAIFPGGNAPCFSSFLLETRSSQTTSAVLKDFLTGSFPECKITVNKSCQCTAFHTADAGFDYRAGGTVVNAGGGDVFNVTVTDSQISGTFNCGTLVKGTSKTWGFVPPDGTTAPDCSGPTPTFSLSTFGPTSKINQAFASAKTASSGGTTITAQTDLVACPEASNGSCSPNSQLSVDKTCVTALQSNGTNIIVRVDYTGQVHNTGNVNITGVQVLESDSGAGNTFNVGTLTPVGTAGANKCYTNGAATCPNLPAIPVYNTSTVTGAASYFPSSGTAATPGRVKVSDTVRATGTDVYGNAVQSHAPGSGVTADCLVCPFGACPSAP